MKGNHLPLPNLCEEKKSPAFSTDFFCERSAFPLYDKLLDALQEKNTYFYPFSQYYLWWKFLFWKAGAVSMANPCTGFFRIFSPWARAAFQNMKITLLMKILYFKIPFYCYVTTYIINYSVIMKKKIFLVIKFFPHPLKTAVITEWHTNDRRRSRI